MAVKCHKKRSGAARPASKLSLLVGQAGSFSSSSSGPGEGYTWSPTQRSPRSFTLDGAVGLGIVAAMNGIPSPAASQYGSATVTKTASAAPGRSAPIPIVAARPASAGVPRPQCWSEEEDMDELSESYTCVTTRVGGDAVRRRVYLDVDVDGPGDQWGSWFGLFSGSPPAGKPAPLPVADFLSRCFRCSKRLHGLDVFMYG
ncbi:hypothetical protein Taro_018130 [Colocasia esculenta]|uniref:FLZ-type domain-containing protein n=1 Tax=Colocasia esculenta TaxID=4460 RepID=A0A843UHZ9_COLES|nr:hypothetical protein [Colocasia esculenta]